MKAILSALLLQAALASTALAAGPAELELASGSLAAGGQILFVSDGSGDPCKRPCSAEPFLAAPDAVTGGLWSLVQTEEGAQWAYDGAPIYLWRDVGVNYGQHYFGYVDMLSDYYGLRAVTVRDAVGEGFAISVDDASVARRPFIGRRTMASYNLGNDASGTVIVTTCVDRAGSARPAAITSSSGSASLDADALEFASIVQYQPAQNAAGQAIAVCGVRLTFVWPETPRGPVSVALPSE